MKTYRTIDSSQNLKLKKVPTRVKLQYDSSEDYETLLQTKHEQLGEAQELLYAESRRAVLIIFQGMDTAGKDGAIKHVMSGVNPQGCAVASFKAPTHLELDHDYFWRISQQLPKRGMIGIFNRSYYEEVLVARVHPQLLLAQRLPPGDEHGKAFWKQRYRDICGYEDFLQRQGYEIIKIFIHISKQEQKIRLLERFDNPEKLWKISLADIEERKYWADYTDAYETCLEHTSTRACPWYIVPGDDKKNARLMISEIIADRLKKMKLTYPKVSAEERRELAKLKKQLEKE